MNTQALIARARQVLQTEAEAIQAAAGRLDGQFSRAVELMLACTGRVIVSGLGKSGLVGRKIAATLASLGTPSAFLHPSDALHGDLGMIRPQDLVLLLSYSGETDELLGLLRFLESQGNRSIVITGALDSTLARRCTLALDGSVQEEACLLNLAPTASAAVAVALGDALAVVLAAQKHFQRADFARFHPGGALGRRLLLTVADVMRPQPLPCCSEATPLAELITTMTSGRLGAAFVLRDQQLVGIVTDGDLRRALEAGINFSRPASDLMSTDPLWISPKSSILEAVGLMNQGKVSILCVKEGDCLVGSIQLHDC